MSVHEAAVSASREWYTPPSLFDALGLTFDLDVASPPEGPVPWVPARDHIAPPRDGAGEPWSGLVWCNPPYGPEAMRFVRRVIAHRQAMLLLPARTETVAFQTAASAANIVCFLRERLWFRRLDGKIGRSSFGSVLMGYGPTCSEALIRANLGWTVNALRGDKSWD